MKAKNQEYRFTGLWAILIKFMGGWAIWRKGYKTRQNALIALEYEKKRTSWPLKVEKIKEQNDETDNNSDGG